MLLIETNIDYQCLNILVMSLPCSTINNKWPIIYKNSYKCYEMFGIITFISIRVYRLWNVGDDPEAPLENKDEQMSCNCLLVTLYMHSLTTSPTLHDLQCLIIWSCNAMEYKKHVL